MDEMVRKVQQWVNLVYLNKPGYVKIDENGKTGWPVIEALITGLQIEEGITSTTGTFGPATMAKCPTLSTESNSSNEKTRNEIMILQGALYCKGYNPTGFTGTYGDGTKAAIKKFQTDAGLSNQDGIATPIIFKALLNMDAFVNVGDAKIRNIQQELNRKYYKVTGLNPCDGRYSRQTNEALIYALQVEEGIAEPTGTFGPATKSKCPTISMGSTKANLVKLLQYALYCNNRDPGRFDGIFDENMRTALINFQKFSALPADGVAGMQTWASLLVSKGDEDRKGTACDCATPINAARAATLKANGYTTVGRYLTGSYQMTLPELETIFAAGLSVFPIYERNSIQASYFTETQGVFDARAAVGAAKGFGFKENTIIYFTVDYDAIDGEVTSRILPYFKAIKRTFAQLNSGYQIGIYGARNVCSRVAAAGYSVSSFVCDMSSGVSGNRGYSLPTDWAFDQIKTRSIGDGPGKIEIDNNISSGKNKGVNSIVYNKENSNNFVSATNNKFFEQLKVLYNTAVDYVTEKEGNKPNPVGNITQQANELVAQYLRKDEYDGLLWILTADFIDTDFVKIADNVLKGQEKRILIDPFSKLTLDVAHMMATFNAIIHSSVGMIQDLAGWAGDLITVGGDTVRYNANYKTTYDAAIDLIGGQIGTFGIQDLLGDVDAVNLAMNTRTGINSQPVYKVFEEYYTTGYSRRYSQFFKNRFNNSFEAVTKDAEYYLNTNNPVCLEFKHHFNVKNYTQEDGQVIAQAFADCLKQKIKFE